MKGSPAGLVILTVGDLGGSPVHLAWIKYKVGVDEGGAATVSTNSTSIVFLLSLTLVLAGCTSLGGEDGAQGQTDDHMDGMEALMATARAAAEGLDTPEKALAAGYVPDKHCIPGMGVHWINPDLFDTEVDEDKPEVLMFLPQDADMSDWEGATFLGIEYVVVTEGTDMNSTDAVPSLHGMPFEGPMAGHTPEMPWHAELHVYLADDLVEHGMHHGEHPAVECPRGTTPPEVGLLDLARGISQDLSTGEQALAAGYAPTSVCDPGMGVHWVKMAAFDTELNASEPEVLMFQPGSAGIYDLADVTLVGLEWVVVTQGTEMNSTETVPALLGVPLDGPMPGHFPGMPWHAELHLWHDQSEAPFGQHHTADDHSYHGHDAVTCPEGTTAPPVAQAVLNAVTPEGVGAEKGQANLTEGPFLGQVSITVSVEGLSPGEHGVHIHTNGDCSPAGTDGPIAAGAAGGHFNPDDASHGDHAGDLGNLVVGEDGTGQATFTANVTLEEGADRSVLNRSLIVHEDADDGETDPSGNSGSRVLCGVIGAA